MNNLPKTPEERAKSLGASEWAPALNLSRWGNQQTVYDGKVEPQEPTEPTQAQRRGIILEPVVKRAFEIKTGGKLSPEYHVIHPVHDFLTATPDGRILNDSGALYEGKTAIIYNRDEYGEQGTAEIPNEYFLQACGQMAVTGAPRVEFGVLLAPEESFDLLCEMVGAFPIFPLEDLAYMVLNTMDFRTYTVERAVQFEKDRIEELRQFWFDNVLARVRPVDIHTMQNTDTVRATTPEEIVLISDYRAEWQAAEEAKAKLETLKAQLIRSIGENKGIQTEDGDKITFNRSKDSVKETLDIDGFYTDLLKYVPKDSLDLVRERNMRKIVTPGVRRFCPPVKKWKKEL